MRGSEDFFVSSFGWINLKDLYEEWREEPPCADYAEPIEGWDLKFGQVFADGLCMLLFENIPETEASEDTAYYRVLLYTGSDKAFRLKSKIRFREQDGFRVDAVSFDPELTRMYLRRSCPSCPSEICLCDMDGTRADSADSQDLLKERLALSDQCFLFQQFNDVWFLRLPSFCRLTTDCPDPRDVVYHEELEDPADEDDDEDEEDDEDEDENKNEIRNPHGTKQAELRPALEELHHLIGLSAVKNKIDELVQYAAFRKSMEKQGRSLGHSVNMNMAFLGNPGTAKTTVARLFARIMKEKGILSKGNLIEVGRADLIAKYTGQTAIKVQKVFEKAEGSVLFIDEAYSLVDGWENEFGDEAIATMVQEMENRRNDLIVIFAGYPDKMEKFLSRNPGLRSRVPSTVLFEDYTEEELVQITETEARSRGYCLAEGTVERIRGICREARKTADFGNGRFCRNLVDAAEMRFAARMKNAGSSCPESPCVLHLEASDFEPPAAAVVPQMRRIGFAVA